MNNSSRLKAMIKEWPKRCNFVRKQVHTTMKYVVCHTYMLLLVSAYKITNVHLYLQYTVYGGIQYYNYNVGGHISLLHMFHAHFN